MANTFKKVIDRQMWVQVSPTPNATAAATCLCSDLRSDVSRNPFVYQLTSATVLNRFNIVSKSWNFVQSPALAGTFGAGAAMVFAPSQGLKGVIAAGATITSIVVSTAFPTAVGLNMLANRGGSGEFGFKIRIIGKAAGKVEERYIVGNTLGTTPTITFDNPLTFTPATGDGYEILSGRVFMLSAGVMAANAWRSIEVATNTLSTGLSIVNLPATVGTDTSLVALDEQYTPYDCRPGEGMVKGAFVYDTNQNTRSALAATAAGASSITGQATGGDAVVKANEYRNFQIRIVQDTVNVTAVGQRAIIASHTAGPSPVYTMGAAWAVTPSSSAKYVIELPNLILGRSTATTTVYTWNYNDTTISNGTNSIVTNAWSTTYFGAAPAANGVSGTWMPSYGIQPDPARNARQSFNYFFRANGSPTIDVLDIAGAVAGTWTSAVVYDGALSLTTGTCGAYAPFENEGRMFYMNIYVASAANQIHRFDVKNRVLSPFTATDNIQAGTATLGQRMVAYAALDGTDTYDVVLLASHLSTTAQELIVLV
jgi:hypothetical protein